MQSTPVLAKPFWVLDMNCSFYASDTCQKPPFTSTLAFLLHEGTLVVALSKGFVLAPVPPAYSHSSLALCEQSSEHGVFHPYHL